MKSCAKFILCGEHSITQEGSAIAFPILNRQLKIEEKEKSGPTLLNNNLLDEEKEEKLKELFRKLDRPLPKGQLVISSQIPIGSGLGSSAALCVSLIKKYAPQFVKEKLFQKAQELESSFHLKSSGIDPCVVSQEEGILYSSNKSFQKVELSRNFQNEYEFVLIDTEISRETKNTQKMSAQKKSEKLLSLIAECSEKIHQAFQSEKWNVFFEGLNENHELLKELGVVNEKMETIQKACLKMGAKAAKMTGAGLGGFVLAVLEKKQKIKFEEKLKLEGMQFFFPVIEN